MKSGWILICRRYNPVGDHTPPSHLNRFNGKGWEVYLKPTEQFSGVVESYCPEYPDIDLLPELSDSSDALKEYIKAHQLARLPYASQKQWLKILDLLRGIDIQHSLSTKRPDRVAKCDTK